MMEYGASSENVYSAQDDQWAEALEMPLSDSGPMPARPGRISGTALPNGVHLSNGVYGSAGSWHLVLGGAYIITLGSLAMIPTYIEAWVIQRLFDIPLPAMLLAVTGSLSGQEQTFWDAALTILPFINFILILRFSSLSGYHAAEHKTVSALERFGVLRYEDVVEMPRVHPRCGTVLLFGLLPAMLVAAPLWQVDWMYALLVAILGWHFRYHTGFFVQNYFTTKPPTRAQLEAGIKAGETLLRRWRRDPYRRVPWLKSIWVRGIPQMVIGLYAAMQIIGIIYSHLHVWLDF
jgi:hypothetical protein